MSVLTQDVLWGYPLSLSHICFEIFYLHMYIYTCTCTSIGCWCRAVHISMIGEREPGNLVSQQAAFSIIFTYICIYVRAACQYACVDIAHFLLCEMFVFFHSPKMHCIHLGLSSLCINLVSITGFHLSTI